MKLLIIGASQGTGAQLVKLALTRRHSISAFSRNPQRLALSHSRLRLIPGDFHQPAAVASAMPGHDAVVITASSLTLKGFREMPDFFSRGTRHVIDAMHTHGVPRLIVQSALGVGDSYVLMNPLGKLFIKLVVRTAFDDHERQERLTRDSGLQWTIARPARLTNGPARNKFVKHATLLPVPSSIARADVAAFLLEAAETDAWLGKTVHLGG